MLSRDAMASLLISLDQARVKGLREVGSKLINSPGSSALSLSSSSSDFTSSPGKKCFSLLTFSFLNFPFRSFNFATASFMSMIWAGPINFGANFLFLPKNSVCAYHTCCPMEKSCALAFLSCWNL